jgi:peptide/nickel transport system substrate-binding protein
MSSDAAPEDIVGTGAFMLGKYVRGERVILKRNPNFWKKDAAGQKLPYIDELVFIVTRDINAMLLNFQQGIVDSYALQSGKDVGELRPKQKEGNFTLYQLGPDAGTDFICFNMNLDAAKDGRIPDYKVKWFRDTRFRLAISYAIDRGAIVRNVLRQLGYPQAAPYTLSSGWFTNFDIRPHPYDPAKAKALLADMGIKDRDGDGILEDDQGHKIKFTVNTNAGNNVREETANFIVTDLKKIGMDVNQLFLEFNLLVDKINTRHDWECLVFALTGTPEPHWGANIWKSNGRLHLWWPSEKEPSFPWEKRIDEIFSQGIQELDKTKRRALYREWVEIIYREQPMVYTAMQERVIAVRNKFGNFFPSSHPTRFAAWHNEEEIFVLDPARQ